LSDRVLTICGSTEIYNAGIHDRVPRNSLHIENLAGSFTGLLLLNLCNEILFSAQNLAALSGLQVSHLQVTRLVGRPLGEYICHAHCGRDYGCFTTESKIVYSNKLIPSQQHLKKIALKLGLHVG